MNVKQKDEVVGKASQRLGFCADSSGNRNFPLCGEAQILPRRDISEHLPAEIEQQASAMRMVGQAASRALARRLTTKKG